MTFLDPEYIVKRLMLENDAFSQKMGMDVAVHSAGDIEVKMKVTSEMLNGFGIAHGGITYSLADSAFAFACNSGGMQAVSVETSISHTAKVVEGDLLTAHTEKLNESRKFARYKVTIRNQDEKDVALFKGTAYFTGKYWENK